MKVLIVAPDFYPANGGYANAITNFVTELTKKDVEIIVYTPIFLGLNKELDAENISVVRSGYHKYGPTLFWELSSYFNLKKIVKDGGVDVVFFETAEFGLLGYLMAKRFKKVAVRIHGCTETEVAIFGDKLYEKIGSFFTKLFFRKVSYVLSTNNYHLQFYKEHFLKNNVYKIAGKKFFVIPNVVSENKYTNLSNKNELLNKYGVDSEVDKKFFFTLGRLNQVGLIQKGMEDLVYSVFLLKNGNKQVFERIKIVLVGKGECKNYIMQLTDNLGISKSFVFIDEMPHGDVLDFMKISDCVVLLSRFEGLSMFALEALSRGSVLLFARSGGISDLVIDEVNGYLVDSQNIEMIEEKIVNIVLKDEDGIQKMRSASEDYFNRTFSSEKSMNRFMEIFNLIKNI